MVAVGGVKGIRDADQVWPGTRKTSLPRQRPSGTPAKLAGYIRRTSQAPRDLGRRQERRLNISKARTRQTSQAAAAAPRARKVSKRAAERFRGLGKLQNAPLNVSEASEGIRDAGQVLPGTRKTSLPRQRPSGTPAKSGRVPGKLRWRPQPPRSRPAAARGLSF